MLKRVTFSLFAVVLVVSLTFAGDLNNQVHKKSNVAFDKNTEISGTKSSTPDKAQVGNAILIGKMWNAYATQASYTNQIYFDPFTNLLAVIKRSDQTGAGSGRIVYQLSDDLGQNWTGQIGPLNGEGYVSGRHPNMVLSNPARSADLGQVSVVASWPELGDSWRYYAFAGDPVGAGNPFFMIDSVYGPGDEMFVNTRGHAYAVAPLVEYVNDGIGDINQYLFKTEDGGESWTKSALSYSSDFYDDTWNGTKGDINKDGNGYILVQGQNAAWDDTYHFATKATHDDGDSWDADWSWVNLYEDVEYEGGVFGDAVQALNYEIDFLTYTPEGSTDASVFFAGTFIDSIGDNTGIYVIDNQSGDWKATKISSVIATSQTLPGSGALSTLNEIEFARSENGSVLALKYADYPSEDATGYDLFVSWYNGESWTAPENYTQTPDINEKYSQLAPRLYNTGGDSWQLLSMYTMFGLDDTEDTEESELWFVDGVTAEVTPVIIDAVDDEVLVNSFSLQQNYPNPFNPSTTIKYSVPQLTNVSVKVYDVLGKEVATLVDAQQARGVYEVNFDASNLSSGLYIYTINAGSFTSSKKMLLMK